MSDVNQATETQLKNIQTRTGKTLEELTAFVQQSGLTKHGEIRSHLQKELGLGYGDANTLTHYALNPALTASPTPGNDIEQTVAEIYTGKKAALRPIHDQLMAALRPFGDFEIAPKKGYVSLRRKKQFAMIGPATNTAVEVGLNVKELAATERLLAMPPGGMCQYKVRLGDAAEVDDELIAWIRQAYASAG
jgi:hypothetical protein